MSCLNCTRIETIATGNGSYVLGTIADFVEAVTVYFENLATGHKEKQAITSGAAGELTVDLSAAYFSEYNDYAVYVVKDSATSLDDRETITDNASNTDTCLIFDLEKYCT